MHNAHVVHMTEQEHNIEEANRRLTCVDDNGMFLDNCTC